MAVSGFWNAPQAAQALIKELNGVKSIIAGVTLFAKGMDDLNALAELLDSASDEEIESYLPDLMSQINTLSSKIEDLEVASFLSGPMDNSPAIITIHAGAGGTESCDWADMLLRQYTRWAERRGFSIEIQDLQPGEGAGISRATIRVEGPYAYGYAKAERGVHRLVRISPFDSNKRRHTSFGSIDVVAEVDDDIEVEIKDIDLRVDTYRSSGKGGQHVNRTDSAVRLTHLPTNIVVTCQSDRSQIKNRATAMKTLKSRIYERMLDEKRAAMERFYGEKGEIGWGHQIRSYVMQPYQMVKDLRTGAQTGNVQAFLDGDIGAFINAWLQAGGPTSRNKDIDLED
jgi:peptide chain release factor 2